MYLCICFLLSYFPSISDDSEDSSINPIIYVVAAILATAMVAVFAVIGFRSWRKSKMTEEEWGDPSGLLAYDALGVQKQAKRYDI